MFYCYLFKMLSHIELIIDKTLQYFFPLHHGQTIPPPLCHASKIVLLFLLLFISNISANTFLCLLLFHSITLILTPQSNCGGYLESWFYHPPHYLSFLIPSLKFSYSSRVALAPQGLHAELSSLCLRISSDGEWRWIQYLSLCY